jgi:hypothetical protein
MVKRKLNNRRREKISLSMYIFAETTSAQAGRGKLFGAENYSAAEGGKAGIAMS